VPFGRSHYRYQEDDSQHISVNDLIRELIDLDMDSDGTKETLISRLDEYHEDKLRTSE
jgi:hypothetical protein